MNLTNYEEAKYDFQKCKEMDPSNRDVAKLLEEAKKLEKNARKKDYYKILEIDKSANEAEIKKAYRKLALKWHPDKNNESEEHHKMAEKMFKDVNEAYSLLSDPKKKQMIDQGMNPDDPGFGGKIFILFFIFGLFSKKKLY
jgi:DnaJ-class molecular chaperone